MDDGTAPQPTNSEPTWKVEKLPPGAKVPQSSGPHDELDESVPTAEHDDYEDEDDG